MTVEFTLDKVEFVALNGGPQFKFTEAISFSVNCETKEETDYLGETFRRRRIDRAVWLAQRQIWSLSWQVNPVFLGDRLADRDPVKADRVMKAMMKMDKIDIAALEKAAKG